MLGSKLLEFSAHLPLMYDFCLNVLTSWLQDGCTASIISSGFPGWWTGQRRAGSPLSPCSFESFPPLSPQQLELHLIGSNCVQLVGLAAEEPGS